MIEPWIARVICVLGAKTCRFMHREPRQGNSCMDPRHAFPGNVSLNGSKLRFPRSQKQDWHWVLHVMVMCCGISSRHGHVLRAMQLSAKKAVLSALALRASNQQVVICEIWAIQSSLLCVKQVQSAVVCALLFVVYGLSSYRFFVLNRFSQLLFVLSRFSQLLFVSCYMWYMGYPVIASLC